MTIISLLGDIVTAAIMHLAGTVDPKLQVNNSALSDQVCGSTQPKTWYLSDLIA